MFEQIKQAKTKLGLALVVSAGLASTVSLWAQLGKIANFKFPDYYEQASAGNRRQVRTLILGAEAQPHLNGLVLIKQMRIENYLEDGQTNLIAQAPECWFDSSRRVASSASRLEVQSANGQFLLEGQGFLCRLTNFSLVISNNLRTVIHQDIVQATKP